MPEIKLVPDETWTLMDYILLSIKNSCERIEWRFDGWDTADRSLVIAHGQLTQLIGAGARLVISINTDGPWVIRIIPYDFTDSKSKNILDNVRATLFAGLKIDLPLAEKQIGTETVKIFLDAVANLPKPSFFVLDQSRTLMVTEKHGGNTLEREGRRDGMENAALVIAVVTKGEIPTESSAIRRYGGDARTLKKFRDDPDVQKMVRIYITDVGEMNMAKKRATSRKLGRKRN